MEGEKCGGGEGERTEIKRRKRRGRVANLGREVGEKRKTEICRMEMGKGNWRKRDRREEGWKL